MDNSIVPGIPSDGSIDASGNAMIAVKELQTEQTRVAPRQVGYGVGRQAQVIIGDDGKPKVLSGDQQHFGQGFYVAKNGIDATTNDDSGQWIFNSNQNIFKVYGGFLASTPDVALTIQDTLGVEGSSTAQNSIFNFTDIGFIPVINANFDNGDNWGPVSPIFNGATPNVFFSTYYNIWATSSSVTIQTGVWGFNFTGADVPVISPGQDFAIFLLQQSVQDPAS